MNEHACMSIRTYTHAHIAQGRPRCGAAYSDESVRELCCMVRQRCDVGQPRSTVGGTGEFAQAAPEAQWWRPRPILVFVRSAYVDDS